MLKEHDFEKQGCQVGNTKKIQENWICILYTRWVVELEDVTLVNNAALCMNVIFHDGLVWRSTMHKDYSPPCGNAGYYTTAPQRETLCCRILCWFAYIVASCVRRRSVFLPSTEYRINIQVEHYHSYSQCCILITRMVSLLSPYHRTHCLPDLILLTVSALQGSHD